jgi:hypothetical protein
MQESPDSGASQPDAGAGAPSTRRSPLDAKGNERPVFLLDFPEDPELERMIAAFEAGNYAEVRRLSVGVIEGAKDQDVRNAALELRRRIEPDPLSTYIVVISAALLLFLLVWAYAVQAKP